MLLFSSYLQNPNSSPIESAAIWVQGESIRYAGKRSELPAEALSDSNIVHLTNTILLPGMINAHSHLELTSLQGLPYAGSFIGWIKEVLKAKNNLDPSEQTNTMIEGIQKTLEGGTTTIGDHLSVNGDIETLIYSPLRGKIFLEVIGVVPEVAESIYQAALSLKNAYEKSAKRFEILPSPHSVHALEPKTLKELLDQKFPLYSIHLAESEEEKVYFSEKSGPMRKFIVERGNALQRMGMSSIQELKALGYLNSSILAVHANYLAQEELLDLAENQISIVHCPLSHQYFSHQSFGMPNCHELKINVALGTDSLASASSLSMFEILRAAEKSFPFLSKKKIFAMATLGGAKALKMEREVGELTEGKKADVIGIQAVPGTSPLESIFEAQRISFSMIDGIRLL